MHMLKIRHLYKPNITCRILSDINKDILDSKMHERNIDTIEQIKKDINIIHSNLFLIDSKNKIYNNKFEHIEKYLENIKTEIKKIKSNCGGFSIETNFWILFVIMVLSICYCTRLEFLKEEDVKNIENNMCEYIEQEIKRKTNQNIENIEKTLLEKINNMLVKY